MSENFIYQDKRRVYFTVEGSKLLSKYLSQCSTSLNFSYPNPTSLHFQHAQARSHASNSYLKSAKRRWIVANNILSVMEGGQACGERRANVITAEWTGHPYGNLALEKQHLCPSICCHVGWILRWNKPSKKPYWDFYFCPSWSGPTFVPALPACWRDKLKLASLHHWKRSKIDVLHVVSNTLRYERRIKTANFMEELSVNVSAIVHK